MVIKNVTSIQIHKARSIGMYANKENAKEILERLKRGNEKYLSSDGYFGDVSASKRAEGVRNGQKPYAVIVTCSDSRVIPESIFAAGIGELFVIRVAGNVIGEMELASIEYAAEHLGCGLAVILGHTYCGAVHSAIVGKAEGHIGALVDKIRFAIGDERDENKACKLNVAASLLHVKESLSGKCEAVGAIYDTMSGKVEFLDTESIERV